MALYPAANQRLIDHTFLVVAPIAAYNRVNLHVAGSLGSLFGFRSHVNRPSSHFWVAQDGGVEQYVDTAIRAEADLEGNDATVSIETEGGENPATAQTQPWTPPQLQAITALVAWIMSTHGIERKLASDAKPGPSSHGLSWHRLGIDGNFPELPSPLAGRKQRGGGMHYTTSTGKVCPGDAKILQIPGILAAITGGGVVTPPAVVDPPVVVPPPSGAVGVDGFWGSATTTRAQVVLGQAADGQVRFQFLKNKQPAMTTGWVFDFSPGHGSPLISRMQEIMAAAGQYQGTVDGVAGPEFTKGLERRFGTVVDGTLEARSPTVMALQRALNGGAF